MIVAGVAVVAILLLEIAGHVETVERLIPERWMPMINEKLNFALIAVAILIFIAAYFDHKSEKRKLARSNLGNAESQAGNAIPAGMPPQPSIVAKPSRLTHKVKCVGVISGEKTAKIGFVNVEIPDQEVGNFRKARLKIRYILAASGEEVATVFPARWIDSDEDTVSVEFVPRYAVLAVYIGNRWHGVETVEVFTPQSEIESHYSRELRPLPSTQLKIEATLIGERNLSLKPFTGVLTLNESGDASFLQDSIERLAH